MGRTHEDKIKKIWILGEIQYSKQVEQMFIEKHPYRLINRKGLYKRYLLK